MRGFFMVILAIGILSSLMGHRPRGDTSSSAEENVFREAAGMSNSEDSSDPAMQTASSDGSSIEVPRSSDGHFYADVDVNGTKLHMLIDTGASGVALSRDDARSAGIATSIGMNDVVGEGADGSIHGEYVQVDRMALGNKTAEDVPAVILNSGTQSLLGQSFLAKFASVEIRGDTMTLR
jgi:aspartyl protease family protein